MNTRAFISLSIGILIIGCGLGGAFFGGIALGKSQMPESGQIDSSRAMTPNTTQLSFENLTTEQREQFRQRFRSQQDGQTGVERSLGNGFSGQRGLAGTLEKISANTLTVNTSQGPLLATITTETTIQKFTAVTIADLLINMQVTITGAPGEDGALVARTIIITPEGQDSLFINRGFGNGGFGNRQQRGQ